MLTAVFPKLEKCKCTQLLRAFFRSPIYLAAVAALMACSEIFALELQTYWTYLALVAVCVLFCDDTLGIMPLACTGYMTFAYQNNPIGEGTLFSRPSAFVQLVYILTLVGLLMLGRLVLYVLTHPARKVPFFSLGFLILGAAYLISGVGYENFVAWKAVVFGIAQIGSLCIFYFYFYYTVDWSRVKKSYLFTMLLMIGLGMLAEIGCMYLHEGVFYRDAQGILTVNRGKLGTGWGVYNNVGGIMAMCVPAPFYFAAKDKRTGWAFALLGCIFMLGVAFTQSRGAILFGAVVFAACIVVCIVKAKGLNRILLIGFFALVAVGCVLGFVFFREKLGGIFSAFTKAGLDSSGREAQFAECWNKFKEHPIFGVGFHNLRDGAAGGYSHLGDDLFVPPRTHNTILQLLASGGVVALAAYLVHRVQTVWLWLRHPTYEKTVAALVVAALLLTSLLDCHFFNYGPGLLYGCVLAFAECTGRDILRSPKKPKEE